MGTGYIQGLLALVLPFRTFYACDGSTFFYEHLWKTMILSSGMGGASSENCLGLCSLFLGV